MRTYQYNKVLDSLRLLRSTFFPSLRDPYIQLPAHISARETLFRWDMIAEETGQYVHEYPSYIPYLSPQPLLSWHLPEKFARHATEHLIQSTPDRTKQIRAQLQEDGCNPEPTPEGWQQIQGWLLDHLEQSQEPLAVQQRNQSPPLGGENQLRPLCNSLVLDLSLLLGEHVRLKDQRYSWAFTPEPQLKHGAWLVKLRTGTVVSDSAGEMTGFYPFDYLRAVAMKLLSDKINGRKETHPEFGLGEKFRQLTQGEE